MTQKDEYGKDRIINLSARKTEDEWSYAIQGFFEKYTPLWFDWISWMFATGGISYLAKKADSLALTGLEVISYIAMYMYFQYFFFSVRVEPYHSWALSRPTRAKRFLAFVPFAVLALGSVFGVRMIIQDVIANVGANE